MKNFLFVLEVDAHKVGVVDSLPLHCTLMPLFRTDKPQENIVSVGKEVLSKQRPIKLVLGSIDYFGEKNDIRVYRLVWNFDLLLLHTKFLKSLNAMGVEHMHPQWVGSGYKPHITCQSGVPFGESHTCTAVSLVEIQGFESRVKKKKVLTRIQLS